MEERLDGGNTGGAARVGDTVRRTAGAWTPAVHAVLRHLEAAGFDRRRARSGVDTTLDDAVRELAGFPERTA